MSIEIESEDVIRLILQFLKENDYNEAASTLESETTIKINTLENKEAFIQEIKRGAWDIVLKRVADLRIPPRKLMDLYEQIVLELAEMRELGAARTLLRQTEPMFLLKQRYPERYLRLEHVLSRSAFDPRDNYPQGMTKEKKRNMIAAGLASEVTVVEPSRLMHLLEDCVKWQQHQGLLPMDATFDLFRNADQLQPTEEEAYADEAYLQIKLPGKNTYAECTAFSPNGLYLVSGSVDGFIEVWNYTNGKLRKDLKYQAEENLMTMDQAVLCLAFSTDSESLASGSTDGKIAIWKLQTGFCTRRFSPAHSQGVTCVSFNKDASHILSCSFDSSIKIHHIKSGNMVQSFEGHTSFVNSVMYNLDNTQIISASSDETVKIWDVTTGACLYSVKPEEGMKVQQALSIPNSPLEFMVIHAGHKAHVLNMQGETIKSIQTTESTKFIAGTLSHQGGLLYMVSEDSILYCFSLASGQWIGQTKVCEEEVIGLSSHPYSNIVAVNNEKRRVYLYKPK
ncbi:WD40 repeat-containing protein SMU1-like protein [Gilbertella persicaria]|uniref:WD40 repeat-containing protein SMU1-like protein n=1 Tax=Gilbertella persicaria TaxID=101096 RepID=UPI00221F094A|nr:WD40 repeat-containing protein SMU1-like protein [Gilbertella persicaria]KAI8072192.1 WD40 repeat-containing protein SMU1-like protein [Gilbertella persicaria]